MIKKIFSSVVIFIFFLLTSCNLIPLVSPSQVVSPTNTTPSGVPVTFGKISLDIPTGLASGASFSTSVNVEYPYINPSFGDMPEHTVITLTGYSLPNRTPRILVFPAEQFAQYTENTQAIIAALKTLQAPSSNPIPEELTTTFYAQTKIFSNDNNHGVRYITEVLTGFAPISNDSIFTYYQGLSADSIWFIEALLPIQAAFLAADSSPQSVVPEDGIPFPFEPGSDVNAIQNYYNEVKTKLNATDGSTFTPSLELLDKLVQSIRVLP